MMTDLLKIDSPDEELKKFKNEKERQQQRKTKEQVSRFLDNYHNSNLYSKSWWPNGLVNIKKKYSYSETGLSYFYEKNNVIHKLNFSQDYTRDYLEYENIEDNQFIITIEYCSNCHNHELHTCHSADLFKNFATYLQKSILIRFPFVRVIMKPIDTEIRPEQFFGTDVAKASVKNPEIKKVRIGALEVQLCYKVPKENRKIILLHSKLQSGSWPGISNLLNDVAKQMPIFNLNVRVYDAENVKDRYPNLEDEELKKILGSKVENIKVNLYKIKSKKIEEICNLAREDIDELINPKKRKEVIMTTKREEKESYSILPSINSNTTNHTIRPSTFKSQSKSVKSALGNVTIFTKENKLISEKEKIDLFKGELLVSLYTTNNGKLSFANMPYDTYLIEVQESPNYHGNALIFSLDQINSEKDLKRYIPVYTQTQSYVKVFVYTENKDKNEDEKVLGAEVLVKNITRKNLENDTTFDDSNLQIRLKENPKIAGRYEGLLVPGTYAIVINKKGYALFTKDVEFKSEENIINLKIEKEIEYKLKVRVISYDKFLPLENAHIKLTCGINDSVVEGVTNEKGKYKFIMSSKEDFTTLYVTRQGFFPCQRTWVRTSIEECKKGIKLNVLMIPEELLQKDHSVIIVTYSNNIEENFTPFYLYSNTMGNYTDITYSDLQSEYGLMTSNFKFHLPLNEEIEEFEKNQDEEEFEEIIRLTLQLKSEKLKAEYKINPSVYMNGLRRYSCECCIYTSKNVFYVSAPAYCKDPQSTFWDLGFLDIKNLLFYETNVLSLSSFERTNYFSDWTNFLQVVIDNKVFSKIFEAFSFNKGILSKNDRLVYEQEFFKTLRNLMDETEISAEFGCFICDMMKNENNYVSYTVMRKKVSSNLKNFFDYLRASLS